MTGRWFEHPRQFETGPLASLTAHFELDGDGDGLFGRYTITAAPAGALGWAMLHSGEFFRGAFRKFSKLAAAAHEYALVRRAEPFDHPPPVLAPGATAKIDAAVARIDATPYGHGLAARLGDFIRAAQEVDMLSIRPLALARRWNVPAAQAIDLCLQAVKAGMLDMQWNLLCPRCRIAKASVHGLDELPTGAHCGTCNIDYSRDFARNVEAVFRPAAAIRPVGLGEYCLFGPMSTPHIRLHVTMPAGSARDVPVDLQSGPYRLRTLEPGDERDIELVGAALPIFRLDATGTIHADTPAGAVAGAMRLVNDSDRVRTFIVEERHWVADALTADRLTTRQSFRDLFSAETLRPGDDVGIQRIVLMFTDLKGSTALYERVGDAAAYRLVREHFAFLAATVREHDGALVKTIGDAVMAAFLSPADAVQAALDMRNEIASFNERQPDKALILKIGVHKGAAIAVTLNDRLDYFGQTVNIAARVQNLADADEIFVSQDVYEAKGVRDELAGYSVEPRTAQLRGVQQELPVFRVGTAAAA